MRAFASSVRSRQIRDGQHGFTLIEMSIVLVIIGLIIGGVVKGQEVVNGARQKMQVSQIDAVKGAVFAFQDKYTFLPGDFTASTVFNTAAGADGNQNGALALSGVGNVATPTGLAVADNLLVNDGTYESTGAWIQLAVTNLLAGIQTLPAGTALTAATNAVYAGKTGNSFLWLANFTTGYGGTAVMVRLQGATGAPVPVLREQDAYSMDLKFDDGTPGTGAIIANQVSTVGTCLVAAPAAGQVGSYDAAGATNNTAACALDFLIE